jgi:hypothetical protein
VARFRAALKEALLRDLGSVRRWIREWGGILFALAVALLGGAVLWRFGPIPLRLDLDALEARLSAIEAELEAGR